MEQNISLTVTYYIQIGIIVKAVLCVVKHFDTGSPEALLARALGIVELHPTLDERQSAVSHNWDRQSLKFRSVLYGLKVITTRYFEEQVLRKRPYIRRDWCERALREPVRREAQPDGRLRHWIFIAERNAYLRVVTLADMVTDHNAFFDRNFKG